MLCCAGEMGRSTHCGGNRNAGASSTVRLRFINEPLHEIRLWSVKCDSECIMLLSNTPPQNTYAIIFHVNDNKNKTLVFAISQPKIERKMPITAHNIDWMRKYLSIRPSYLNLDSSTYVYTITYIYNGTRNIYNRIVWKLLKFPDGKIFSFINWLFALEF